MGNLANALQQLRVLKLSHASKITSKISLSELGISDAEDAYQLRVKYSNA